MKTSLTECSSPKKEEQPFQFYIQTIGRGRKRRRSLTQEEAREAMRLILSNRVTPMQLGAFLMLIRVREETPEEAAGFVEALREKISPPVCSVDIDWGSYAGKRRQLPWFMLALTLLTQKGYSVCLHGIEGQEPNRLYTQKVAQLLDWPIASSLLDAKQKIEQTGMCYIPVECFAPEVKGLMACKEELGLRSPIHTLARMMNPFNARLSVHGVFHKGYDDIHQQAATYLSDAMTVAFCGDGGEAEVRPDRNTEIKVTTRSADDESIDKWSFSLPKVVWNTDPTQKCLDLNVLLAVWTGQQVHEYGQATVIQTVAMVLMALEHLTLDEAMAQATQYWHER